MFISDVLHFSKEDSEAEVSVSDGQYSVNCYAYPVNMITVKQHIDTILGFECTNITKSDIEKYEIQKLPSYYAYLLTAQVTDKERGIVRLGELYISMDSAIPKDIINGEYISFSVVRLDCE